MMHQEALEALLSFVRCTCREEPDAEWRNVTKSPTRGDIAAVSCVMRNILADVAFLVQFCCNLLLHPIFATLRLPLMTCISMDKYVVHYIDGGSKIWYVTSLALEVLTGETIMQASHYR